MKFTKKHKYKKKRIRHKYKNRVHSGQSMEEYEERNAILIELGYKDYHAYLRSPLWKAIRTKKLTEEPKCFGCNRDENNAQMQVHHGAYTAANLAGKSDEHLFSICSRCHHWIEVTKGGFKRTPTQATKILFAIRKQRMCMEHAYHDQI